MEGFDSYDWSEIGFPTSYAHAIFDFARARQFKRGLEIGFDQGASALALLRGSPNATLESIDVYPCEGGRARLARSEVADRHRFLQADSRIELPNRIGFTAESFAYDMIYIDGDHLYDVAKADIENAARLLAPGGVMIIDDADPDHKHFGVYRAVSEFCVNNGWTMTPVAGSPNKAVFISKI